MEQTIKNTDHKNNIVIDSLIVFWIVGQGFDFVFLYLLPGFLYFCLQNVFQLITYISILTGFVLALRKEMLKEAFFIIIGIAILFVSNLLFHPENQDAIRSIMRLSFTTIPCYLLVRSRKSTFPVIRIISIIGYIIIPLVIFIQITGKNISINNYLNVSYALLPFLIVLLGLQYNKFQIIRFLVILSGILTMIVYGGRMPLVILFFSIILYEIKALGDKKRNLKTLVKYILILFVTILFLFQIDQIKLQILTRYSEQGTYSRTITRILESNLLDSSGRGVIYKNCLQLILEHPILGNGIGADSIMIREKKLYSPNYDVNNIGGLHAHNGILEFGVEFGLLLLFFSVFVLVKGCANAYQKLEISYDFIFLILLLSIGIIRTVLGSPYWYSQTFWMGIAFIATIVQKPKEVT